MIFEDTLNVEIFFDADLYVFFEEELKGTIKPILII